MKDLLGIETAIPGLHASTAEPLPFAPALDVRAFLLKRDQGNLLIYSAAGLETDAPAIQDLGGIWRQYLNHRHEAGFISDWVTAPLFVHEHERDAVASAPATRPSPSVTRWVTSRRSRHRDTPAGRPPTCGTPACTVCSSPATRSTSTTASGSRPCSARASATYLESLELIRELDFDVLVPWAASGGQPCYSVTNESDARRRIDAVIERVWRGEEH